MIVNVDRPYSRGGVDYVDVRSHIVQSHIKKWKAIELECEGKRMVIPPQRLRSYVKLTNNWFPSKWEGKFQLYSYKWKPETEEEELKRCLI